MKLSQRIAFFSFCCFAGSALHSLFAQTAAEGLRVVVTDATKPAMADAAPGPIDAPGSAAPPWDRSRLMAEPDASLTAQQSLDSSISRFHSWSIRNDLAQSIHSLRSSTGQEAVPEGQLQVLAPITKK